MKDIRIMILGSEWTIKYVDEKDYKTELENAWGFCYHNKPIILIDKSADKYNENHAMRHEIIHAFKNESGLRTCEVQNDEQQVDWMATQLTKIYKVYKELKIL